MSRAKLTPGQDAQIEASAAINCHVLRFVRVIGSEAENRPRHPCPADICRHTEKIAERKSWFFQLCNARIVIPSISQWRFGYIRFKCAAGAPYKGPTTLPQASCHNARRYFPTMMFSYVCQAKRSRRCISSKGSREEAATTKQLLFLAASNRMSFQASGFDSPIVTGYGPCHCVCLFLGTSVQEIEVLTQVGSEDLFPDTSSLLVWWIRLILPRRKKVLSKIDVFMCLPGETKQALHQLQRFQRRGSNYI